MEVPIKLIVPKEIPGSPEWAGYESDLDVKHAHRLMFGKTVDEVQIHFGDVHSIERADELLFMPYGAFRYYVFAFAQFMLSPAARGDSDSANCFLGLLAAREKKEKNSVTAIYSSLRPVVEHIAAHQEYYDADISIYGNFKERAAEIDQLCAAG